MVPATEMTGMPGHADSSCRSAVPAVPAGQRVVEQGHVVVAVRERRGELSLRGDAGRVDLVPGPREAELLELGVLRPVVDAQEAQRRARRDVVGAVLAHSATPSGSGSAQIVVQSVLRTRGKCKEDYLPPQSSLIACQTAFATIIAPSFV